MKVIITKRATLVSIVVMSLFLLAGGCGSEDAKSEGCPSNSTTANSTDTLTGPANESLTISSPAGGPFSGGTVFVTPLVFSVTDQQGNPKNGVCIRFYSDGFYYTDNLYTTPITVPGNTIIGVTDDVGKVTVFWSTENLPAAAPVNGTTAGKDASGQSFVQAYSGVLTTTFEFDWTVRGEQTP